MVRIENILCLVDFSEDSSHALTYARTIAELCQTTLYVMHVISNATSSIYGETKGDYLAMELNAKEKTKQKMAGYDNILRDYSNHQLITKVGEIVPSVLETVQAKKIGMTVMGSHGHGGLRHLLLGSNADKILHSVECPVTVIRHPSRRLPA